MEENADRGGNELWRRLLGAASNARVDATTFPAGMVERAATVAPSTLVASAVGDELSPALRDKAAAVAQYGRYLVSRHLQVLQWLGEIDVPVVSLKGLAAGLLDWRDPGERVVGDLDILVRRNDLPRVVDALWQRGFRFGGELKPRWGFLSDASFVPFYSIDRVCNVDLHIEPDSYPLHLGLNAEAVFAAAQTIERNGLQLAVPSAEHALLIAVANLAKDKFSVGGARKLFDIARLLQRARPFDWHEVENRAARAHLLVALRTSLSLAVALGLPVDAIPAPWRTPPGGLRLPVWRNLLQSWRQFDNAPASALRLAQREWLLAATPAVAARLGARRLRGLILPRSGVPFDANSRPAQPSSGGSTHG